MNIWESYPHQNEVTQSGKYRIPLDTIAWNPVGKKNQIFPTKETKNAEMEGEQLFEAYREAMNDPLYIDENKKDSPVTQLSAQVNCFRNIG